VVEARRDGMSTTKRFRYKLYNFRRADGAEAMMLPGPGRGVTRVHTRPNPDVAWDLEYRDTMTFKAIVLEYLNDPEWEEWNPPTRRQASGVGGLCYGSSAPD
jgi:hypothetical protein